MVHAAASIHYNLLYMFHTGCLGLCAEGVCIALLNSILFPVFLGVPGDPSCGDTGDTELCDTCALSPGLGCLSPVPSKNPLFSCFFVKVTETWRCLQLLSAWDYSAWMECSPSLKERCVVLWERAWCLLVHVISCRNANRKWLYKWLCECVFLSVGVLFQMDAY